MEELFLVILRDETPSWQEVPIGDSKEDEERGVAKPSSDSNVDPKSYSYDPHRLRSIPRTEPVQEDAGAS